MTERMFIGVVMVLAVVLWRQGQERQIVEIFEPAFPTDYVETQPFLFDSLDEVEEFSAIIWPPERAGKGAIDAWW